MTETVGVPPAGIDTAALPKPFCPLTCAVVTDGSIVLPDVIVFANVHPLDNVEFPTRSPDGS